MTELDLPDGAVITAQLHIVEFIDTEDGELKVRDFSEDGFGNELTLEVVRKMAAEAVFEYEAPLMAVRVAEYLCLDDDEYEDDEDDGDEEVDEVQPVS